MTKPVFVTLICLLVCHTGNAQLRHRRPSATRDFYAANRLTGNIGLGDAGGFAAISSTIEYEHFFLNHGLLSFATGLGGYYGGTITISEIDEGEIRSQLYAFHFDPALRFHPLGNDHRVDLSVGLTLPFGLEHRRDYTMKPRYNFIRKTDDAFFGMVKGTVCSDFKSARGGIFGLFFEIGYIYSHTANDLFAKSAGSGKYVHAGIRFGGQW